MKKKSTISHLLEGRLRKMLFVLVLNLFVFSFLFSSAKASDFSQQVRSNVSLSATSEQTLETITIKGLVKDNNKLPLPGVTILVKIDDTSLGAVTETDGTFAIKVPKREKITLRFSFVGMKTKEVIWQGEKLLEVMLEEDIHAMEEVIVTGYGNISKGNYTGAATTVKGEDIIMAGVSSVDQMLQGVIPGMLVMNPTGQVGASPKVRVRGTSTLLGNQEPVWVVDGVIQRDPLPFNSDNTQFSMDEDDITKLAGNAISWLNPEDIETITVLKDASATAIYGSQAANGVIVITTKKASIGKVVVNYSGDLTIGQRPRYGLYNLMNSAEIMQFHDEFYREKRKYAEGGQIVLEDSYQMWINKLQNREITEEEMRAAYKRMAGYNTDWFDILFRNSLNHKHTVSINGGSEKLQNRTSFSFNQQKGEAKGNNQTNFSIVSNTTANLWDKITINLNLKGSIREVDGFAYGVSPFNYAYNTSRAIACFNEDGTLAFHERKGSASTVIENLENYKYNILNEIANTGSETSTSTWGGTFDMRWELLPGLQYQGLFSYTNSSTNMKKFATEESYFIAQKRGYDFGAYEATSPEALASRLSTGGLLETEYMNRSAITVRNSLVFNKLFADLHAITLQVGIETNSVKTKGQSESRYGYMPSRGETFVDPPLYYTHYSSGERENDYAQGYSEITNRLQNDLSWYGSAVYIFNDRYVFNTSARVDASNRFGQDKNKRFEPTWSVGLKWRVAQEGFLQNRWWINNLDVYASYGYQGNAVTTVTPELTAFNYFKTYYNAYSLYVNSLPYPDLGWEKTKTYNLGIDAAFLKGRLNFNFNYYKKDSDVLAARGVALEVGVKNGIVAGTKMENSGYDVIVNVVPVKTKDFTWQFSVNTGVAKNKVTNNNQMNEVPNYLKGSAIVPGEAYSTFYSFQMKGLDPVHGQPLFAHIDLEEGEDNTNFNDPTGFLVKSGKFTPDFSGGFSTSFKYKDLTFSALFAVQWGGHNRIPSPFNHADNSGKLKSPEYNVSRKVMNRWKKPGDEAYTDIPALPLNNEGSLTIPLTLTSQKRTMYRYNMYQQSDALIGSTDMIRCRQIALSYDLNREFLKRYGVSRMQLKASMTNPFMWVRDSKWDGLDPETANWPARRTTSLSLQVMF